jgi:glycosyltransferase involved in cell wall biosynthesis
MTLGAFAGACEPLKVSAALHRRITAHQTNDVTTSEGHNARSKDAWPKISFVTPVRNSVNYIENTFDSVLGQKYPNLEYVVVDGGSTDGTIDVIRSRAASLASWISEPDRGMYDAINKGFSKTTGEIMGWISATDMLHAGALKIVATIFQTFPDVEWITGIPTFFNEDGMVTHVAPLPRWSRPRFLAGANFAIQQESTFWRRSLWERAGSRLDDNRRNGSDFELWIRFFRYAKLYTVKGLIGGYRVHSDALGIASEQEARDTHAEALARERSLVWYGRALAPLHKVGRMAVRSPLGRRLWAGAMRPLYRLPGADLAGVIEFRNNRWVRSRP